MTRFSPRTARAARRMAVLLGVTAACAAAAAPAQATTPLGTQARVSAMGADGNAAFTGRDVASAYNPRTKQTLVVWEGDATTDGELEVWGRLVDAAGVPVGTQFRVSQMGVDGNAAADGSDPDVAYNPHRNEFLVAWEGSPGTAPLAAGESEIFVQRLDASGAEIGTNDARISDMGPDGVATQEGFEPFVVYNETSKEYLVAWEGEEQAPGESEIYAQRLTGEGAETGPNDVRVSDMGVDGSGLFDAFSVVAEWNARANEYLLVWEGDDATDGEFEIHAQRLTADGAETGTNDLRVSRMGPDGDAAFDASDPGLAYNVTANEYLVTWEGDTNAAPLVDNEFEIYAQRLDATGAEVGTDDARVSDMGTDGNAAQDAGEPTAAWNFRSQEYLVAWQGTDGVAGDQEIYAQRLTSAGAETGDNDVRVSVTGPDGDGAYAAVDPYVVYASQANEHVVAWDADSNTGIVDEEFEAHVRRFGAGPLVAVAAQTCKSVPAPAPAQPGDPSKITLTTSQLLINQRIDQAAIRRANAVQAWLDAGVEGRDLCRGALGTVEMSAAVVTGYTGLPITTSGTDPRPVVVAAATPGDPSKVTLSVNQLLINQRISQAAIRRLNALKARMDAGLTGGDVKDGTLPRDVFTAGTAVLFTPPAAQEAKSVTKVAPPTPGDPSKVKLTTTQILINQRISQAAVRRANDLIARIGDGLTSTDLKDATLTGADLQAGVAFATS